MGAQKKGQAVGVRKGFLTKLTTGIESYSKYSTTNYFLVSVLSFLLVIEPTRLQLSTVAKGSFLESTSWWSLGTKSYSIA